MKTGNKLKAALLLLAAIIQWSGALHAQTVPGNLPVQVKPVTSGTPSPLIFYITGDGGMKKFSANVIDEFQRRQYPVIALNALKYFWNKKTPAQAAADVSNLIRFYQRQWNNNAGIILVGYSLGADVMPFIFTSLPAALQAEVHQVVLLSPSRFTDLEVHLSDMLGKGSNKGSSVPAEINKINKPLLLVFGAEEKDFNPAELTVTNYKKIVLPGGHAYDEDASGVAQRLMSMFVHLQQ